MAIKVANNNSLSAITASLNKFNKEVEILLWL
jgi:hypothetical protein